MLVNQHPSKVIVAQMTQRQWSDWPEIHSRTDKRLLRNTAFFAAVSLCFGGCTWYAMSSPDKAQEVMSHLTAGFEYDETLGRLQLVSRMLPESAMVFLNTDSANVTFQAPSLSKTTHAWTSSEPWLEYASGDITACQAGEIVTIVQNHAGAHTVRILHNNGYESVYSGLSGVHLSENDHVSTGQTIGTSADTAAFELRKDGLSVLPTFSLL